MIGRRIEYNIPHTSDLVPIVASRYISAIGEPRVKTPYTPPEEMKPFGYEQELLRTREEGLSSSRYTFVV